MSTTPYMNMTLPTVTVTLGPLYATENNAAFNVVDSHDHTSGQGIQIPTAGIALDADLTFGSYNAITLRSTRYTAQASPLGLVTDIGCIYVSGVDMWFNDGNGVQIQLTASGALNAASIGGIGGDYATSTASVAYSDSTKTFKFLQDTNKSSLLDTGTILLRRTDVTSSAATTIRANTSLTVGYGIMLPTALPVSASFCAMDASGNLTFTNSLALLALSGVLSVGTSATIGTSLTVGTTLTVGTDTTLSNLTESTVLVLDASKKIISSFATTFLKKMTNFGNLSWTPTGSLTTNSTYTGNWRQIGDCAEYYLNIEFAGTPNNPSTITFNLPASQTIDTAKLIGYLNECIIGNGAARDVGLNFYPLLVTYDSTTTVKVKNFFTNVYTGNTYPKMTDSSRTIPFNFGNGDSLCVNFKLPIVEFA